MKLYLVQHGKVCAKDANPERPLTDQSEMRLAANGFSSRCKLLI